MSTQDISLGPSPLACFARSTSPSLTLLPSRPSPPHAPARSSRAATPTRSRARGRVRAATSPRRCSCTRSSSPTTRTSAPSSPRCPARSAGASTGSRRCVLLRFPPARVLRRRRPPTSLQLADRGAYVLPCALQFLTPLVNKGLKSVILFGVPHKLAKVRARPAPLFSGCRPRCATRSLTRTLFLRFAPGACLTPLFPARQGPRGIQRVVGRDAGHPRAPPPVQALPVAAPRVRRLPVRVHVARPLRHP